MAAIRALSHYSLVARTARNNGKEEEKTNRITTGRPTDRPTVSHSLTHSLDGDVLVVIPGDIICLLSPSAKPSPASHFFFFQGETLAKNSPKLDGHEMSSYDYAIAHTLSERLEVKYLPNLS